MKQFNITIIKLKQFNSITVKLQLYNIIITHAVYFVALLW